MFCNLSKDKTLKKEYYVSVLTGNKFSYYYYINSDTNTEWCKKNTPWKIPLPLNEYPYTIEYIEEYSYECCKLCTTCKKY